MKTLILAAALAASLVASVASANARPVDNHGFNGAQFWQNQANRDG